MKKHFTSILLIFMLSATALPAAVQAQHNNVVTDGYLFQKGRLLRVTKGQLVPVTDEVVLENGLRVLPSGVLIQKNGIKHNLRDGQAIDDTGRILFPETRHNGTIILVPSPGNTAKPEYLRRLKNIPSGKTLQLHKHQNADSKFKFKN